MFYTLKKTIIIFWSIISFICLVVLLYIIMWALFHNQTKEQRSKSQADPEGEKGNKLQAYPDVERGDDQKVGRRLTSAPLTQHPTSTEKDHACW
jgi:membrane protein implicated in regulation of membrane protease activity